MIAGTMFQPITTCSTHLVFEDLLVAQLSTIPLSPDASKDDY
jgi:hypothetical protein